MQNLLRERVPVRDLETILETLGDYAGAHEGPGRADRVRPQRAGPHDLQAVRGRRRDRLWCVTLDPALEELINGHLERSERGTTNTMPPQTAQQIVQQIADKATELTQTGRSAVVLCSPQIRGVAAADDRGGACRTSRCWRYNEVVPEVTVGSGRRWWD